MTAQVDCMTAFVDMLAVIHSFSRNTRRKPRWDWAREKKHPVDIVNGTENSSTISVCLLPAMPCIDFCSSFLGHLHTSKPKLHHSSHFD